MVRQAAAVAVALVLSPSPLFAQDTLFTVASASANVHAGPSTASPVVGTAARGDSFEVVRELGSWVRISWPAAQNGAGYLHVTWGTLSRRAAADAQRTNTVPAVPAAPEAPALRPSAEPVSSSASTQIDLQPRPTTPRSPGTPVLVPSHVVGVGGRMSAGPIGFAATGRMWVRDPLGIQVEVGRSTSSSGVAVAARLSTMNTGASAVYLLPDLLADAVWVRPYLGAGASLYRSTLNLAPGVSSAVDTGPGYQAFGGAEFTWANLPQLALSADLRQEWAPTPFSGFEVGGLGVALSVHWYVK